MDQAVAGEPLSRPYMGIHFVTITRQIADEQKLPVNVGALVGGLDANGNPVPGVESGKPADLGGVKDGDIIVSINDKVIDEEHPLDATLAQFSPGDTVDVKVLRDGATSPSRSRSGRGRPVSRLGVAADGREVRPRRRPTGSSAARPG